MYLKQLVINNFGVYEGTNEFNLQVQHGGNDKRNLIVIKGPNGSGKSTFFQAISLALFGRQSIGNRVGNEKYQEYIFNKIHRNRLADSEITLNNTEIALSFEYIQSGEKHEIEVFRNWERQGKKISETLDITVDDSQPDVEEEEYQMWLNDKLPVGLKNIMFFDAEDMNSLVNSDRNLEFKSVMKRLLGLHLLEQLEDDLTYYLRKQGGGNKFDTLKSEVSSKQNEIDDINMDIDDIKSAITNLERRRADLEGELEHLENRLASEGGGYAEKREYYKNEVSFLDKEINDLSDKIRDLSSQLLPFTLAPLLALKLNKRLAKELEIKQRQIADEFIRKRVNKLENTKKFKSLLEENSASGKKLYKLIKETIIPNRPREESTKIVHELSNSDIHKLQLWIHEIHNGIPELGKELTRELKKKKEKKKRNNKFLKRAPEEEKIAPLARTIRDKEIEIENIRKTINDRYEELGSCNYKKEEIERELERLISKLEDIEKESRQLELAEKSKFVLKSYHESLSTRKLQDLNEEILNCFNQLCTKEQLLSKAEVDPNTFEITLRDNNQETIKTNDLSMGERQIYGLALLWALRKISGYTLPLLIDTPTARLDRVHRENFIDKYIPNVSEQLLLFTTNVEMDEHIQPLIKPYTSHLYELKFVEEYGKASFVERN